MFDYWFIENFLIALPFHLCMNPNFALVSPSVLESNDELAWLERGGPSKTLSSKCDFNPRSDMK